MPPGVGAPAARSRITGTTAAVVASVDRGRKLDAAARHLSAERNAPFDGLVRVQGADTPPARFGDVTLRVLAPDQHQLDRLEEKWRRDAADLDPGDPRHGHHNPSVATLKMISAARPDDDFTLHFTNRRMSDGIGEAVAAFLEAEGRAGRRYASVFRDDGRLSLTVDLLDDPAPP